MVAPEIFGCERANVVLVHRWKKFLFRIEDDERDHTQKYVTYDLSRGLTG